jgi:hypothetical protein
MATKGTAIVFHETGRLQPGRYRVRLLKPAKNEPANEIHVKVLEALKLAR